jgi:tripartite-type tricarboxylate transporter receptor subunit TctC
LRSSSRTQGNTRTAPPACLGSILHLCGEQFKALAGGLDIVHVPYRGSAMMSDLVGGQISMAFDATPTAMPQAQAVPSARSAPAWRRAYGRCRTCRR